MKIFQTKLIVVFGLLLFITPIIFTPFMVNALESNHSAQSLYPNNGTVYSKITDLEGALSDGPDEDTYLVNMEEGKEYSFRVEFNIAITGLFNLQISRPGEVSAFGWDNAFWTSGDAGLEKTLNFTVIADTTGEHALVVENGATGSAATYVLNFSRISGGLDWWWYVVIGGGGLVVLIIIIVIISASMKGKKSKKKSKKKK
ncbi:MAG: hypothetical protein GPJ52_08625 [Candidatus Heimdallarchaeota archaeon]|nr:hypothetical protein [Candidatus Heimdallarchaeota archaeon]